MDFSPASVLDAFDLDSFAVPGLHVCIPYLYLVEQYIAQYGARHEVGHFIGLLSYL